MYTAKPPLAGRGGWTWYTGSASWLYRIALEDILGFHLRGNKLTLRPCVPANWPSYEITYKYKSATYQIQVENTPGGSGAVRSVTVDGVSAPSGVIEWPTMANSMRCACCWSNGRRLKAGLHHPAVFIKLDAYNRPEISLFTG